MILEDLEICKTVKELWKDFLKICIIFWRKDMEFSRF